MEGDVSGVRTPQNSTEIRINTAQNNISKPQTALKLPKKFLNTANYLVLAQYRNLKKNSAKPHQRKPLHYDIIAV